MYLSITFFLGKAFLLVGLRYQKNWVPVRPPPRSATAYDPYKTVYPFEDPMTGRKAVKRVKIGIQSLKK